MPGGRPRKVSSRHKAAGAKGAKRRQELRLARQALQQEAEPKADGEGDIKFEVGEGEDISDQHHHLHHHPPPPLNVKKNQGGRSRKGPSPNLANLAKARQRLEELRLERCARQEEELLRAAQVRELLAGPVPEPRDQEVESGPLPGINEGEDEVKIEAREGEQDEVPDISDRHHHSPPNKQQGQSNDKVEGRLNEEKMSDDLRESIAQHPNPSGSTKKVITRPLVPSSSFCFVCVTPLEEQTDDRRRSKVTDADFIFLLTSILEFSPVQARHYLTKLEGPEKWIGLCLKCWNMLREVSTVKERIVQLEKDALRSKCHMLQTLMGTLIGRVSRVGQKGQLDCAGVGVTEQILAIENILGFVRSRKYFSIQSTRRTRSSDDKQSAPAPTDKNSELPKMSTGRPRYYFGTRVRRPPPKSKSPLKRSSAVKKKNASTEKEDDMGHHQHQYQHEDVDEGLIFIETDAMDNGVLAKDPLSFEGDDDDIEINGLLKKVAEPPPALSSVRGIKRKIYYCGLCDNDKVYRSEKQLQLHTNKCHRPPTPQNPGKRKKRRRKQKFSSGSDSEEEYYGDYLLPDVTFPNNRVAPTIDDNSPAFLEPASKIVKKIKFQLEPIMNSLPKNSSGKEAEEKVVENPIPTFKLSIKSVGRAGKSPAESTTSGKLEPEPEPAKEIVQAVPSDFEANDSDNVEKTEEEEEDKAVPQTLLATEWEHAYDCPACPNVKKYGINRITQHLAIHQRRPYKCTVCSALLPSDDALMEEHWKEKHSGELLPPQRFLKVSLEPGEFWMCEGENCDEGFTSEQARNSHELNCSLLNQSTNLCPPVFDTPYSCKICDKPSRNSEEWRLHRALHHPEVDRMSCLCCDLSFAEKTVDGGGSLEVRNDVKMLEHIMDDHAPSKRYPNFPAGRIHDECESCGLVFALNNGRDTRSHFLEVHGIPQGGKIYSCPLACGDMFTRSRGVRLHVNACHLSRDLQICDVCGASFKQSDSLNNHKFQKHGILPEGCTIWTCPVEGCDFQAIQKQSLTHHSKMVHEGVRKHSCKYCGKRFSDSSKLRVHRQIHENKEKKPYQCELCGASFAVRNYLYIHKRLSHEGRVFPSTNRKRVPVPGRKPKKDQVELGAPNFLDLNTDQPQNVGEIQE